MTPYPPFESAPSHEFGLTTWHLRGDIGTPFDIMFLTDRQHVLTAHIIKVNRDYSPILDWDSLNLIGAGLDVNLLIAVTMLQDLSQLVQLVILCFAVSSMVSNVTDIIAI